MLPPVIGWIGLEPRHLSGESRSVVLDSGRPFLKVVEIGLVGVELAKVVAALLEPVAEVSGSGDEPVGGRSLLLTPDFGDEAMDGVTVGTRDAAKQAKRLAEVERLLKARGCDLREESLKQAAAHGGRGAPGEDLQNRRESGGVLDQPVVNGERGGHVRVVARKAVEGTAGEGVGHALREEVLVAGVAGGGAVAQVGPCQFDGERETFQALDDGAGRGVLVGIGRRAPGLLHEEGVGVVRPERGKEDRVERGDREPAGEQQVGTGAFDGEVRLDGGAVLDVVEHDEAAVEGADATEGEVELAPVVRLGTDPAGLLGRLDELRLDLLVGRDPDDAAGVLVEVGVGVLDGELGLAEAAEAGEGGGLPDARRGPVGELAAHLGEGVGAADDLVALLGEGDVGRPVCRLEVGDGAVGRGGVVRRVVRLAGGIRQWGGRGVAGMDDLGHLAEEGEGGFAVLGGERHDREVAGQSGRLVGWEDRVVLPSSPFHGRRERLQRHPQGWIVEAEADKQERAGSEQGVERPVGGRVDRLDLFGAVELVVAVGGQDDARRVADPSVEVPEGGLAKLLAEQVILLVGSLDCPLVEVVRIPVCDSENPVVVGGDDDG